MNNQELLVKLLKSSITDVNGQTLDKVIESTTMKVQGPLDRELHLYTRNEFSKKIIERNLFNVKNAYNELTGNYPLKLFINNVKYDVEIKELKSKDNISKSSIKNLNNKERVVEGYDDKEESIFSYDTSIWNKKTIIVKMHNKYLGKYFEEEVETKILTGFFNRGKRNKLSNKLNKLLQLKYESFSSDTEELLKVLNIK